MFGSIKVGNTVYLRTKGIGTVIGRTSYEAFVGRLYDVQVGDVIYEHVLKSSIYRMKKSK